MKRRFEALDTAYVVPFEWGSLRVTQDAHETYDLQPLVPTTKELDSQPQVDQFYGGNVLPVINLTLLSPDESDKYRSSNARVKRNKITSPLTLDLSTPEEVSQELVWIVSTISSAMGESPDTEAVDMIVKQINSDRLNDPEFKSLALGVNAFASITDPLRKLLQKRSSNKYLVDSLAFPGGAAASILAINGENLLNGQEYTATQVQSMSATIATLGLIGVISLKRGLKNLPAAYKMQEHCSVAHATTVANDIHNAFSPSTNFEQKLSDWPVFGQDEIKPE